MSRNPNARATWTKGAFAIQDISISPDGRRSIDGWHKGCFGIDRRDYRPTPYADLSPGWMVNHLPTGLRLIGVEGSLAAAKRLADDLLNLGDWNFSDHSEADKELKKAANELIYSRKHDTIDASAFYPAVEHMVAPE